MKLSSGTLAFLVAFVIAFAVVGVSYALAGAGIDSVPYDPGFPN